MRSVLFGALLVGEANDQPLDLCMPKVQHQERNHRIQKYLSLVQPIARRFAYRSGCDCDDLIQVGCLGLIRLLSATYKQRKTHFMCL